MKKIVLSITSVLMVLTMLAACGKSVVTDINVKEVYQKITESVTMPKETVELVADDLTDYYGIEADKVEDFVAVQDACGYKDEIVIIKAVDDASATEIADLLNKHIDYQKDSMKNYDPAQFSILGTSEVISNGSYVAMFISADQSKMADIYNGFFK
ncbi:MAG: DUF4358 domain-containing protein [Clostridia bacterium]|nr:DUF4358 domain-containing protein [Clostridia bacterium]